MLKLAIIGCLCAIVAIRGQDMPPPPDGLPPPPGGPPPIPRVNSRVVRQSFPMQDSMPGAFNGQQGGGGPGNMGMNGLGNIPDPTEIVVKVQEIGRQFMNGRRRRHLSAF